MALTKEPVREEVVSVPDAAERWMGRPIVILAFALVLLVLLGWPLIAHPDWSAPTRDPAWYTWRANIILGSDPGSLAKEWGPSGVFAGGYRVMAPLAGALLQRIAGVDQYSFSALLMVGIPVLTGLALGAAAYRARHDILLVLLSMLAAAALFLTTPYVGYLDNTLMIFLLCLMFPFLGAARTSWGARTALFLIGVTAALTHPTTCVIFGATLIAVFGWRFLTSRLSLASALKSDGPMLLSVGIGMIVGLSMWFGIWGPAAKFSEAAVPPPYTKGFFLNRLKEWVLSLQPAVIAPFILVAIVSVVWTARRARQPAGAYEVISIGWLLPLAGSFTFLTGAVVPYYRFMNATAAIMPLTALGATVAFRRFLRTSGRAKVAGILASLLVIGSLGWVLQDGLRHRWVSEQNQWAPRGVRVALAAVHEVVAAAGERPNVIVVNYRDTADSTGTNTAYGWAKTYTNVFRTGLPGTADRYSATYLGTLENFLAGRPTLGASRGYNTISNQYWRELLLRRTQYPEPPVVFLYGGFYGGNEDVQAALAKGVPIGPNIVVVEGQGLYGPPQPLIARANAAAQAERSGLDDHADPFGDPLHSARVLAGLFLLIVLPGLLAGPFFELEDWPSRIAAVPGMSIVLVLLSGVAVLAAWRGSLGAGKAWVVVGIAAAVGAALRLGRPRIVSLLSAFGGFFNRMFAVFTNRSFSALMGTQFVAQMADGIVQGALFKTIAFGGDKGFNLSNAPSARYVLGAVLLLYVPYTIVSPFVGVAIDRFDRRLLLIWSNAFRAAVVAAVALAGFGRVPNGILVVILLIALAGTRMLLAVKSAGIPAVLQGKDLLQGNGLSQAGGALFQVVGLGVAGVGTAAVSAGPVALVGAVGYAVAAIVATNCANLEYERRRARLTEEIRRVFRDIAKGFGEVSRRAPAALALSSFQWLRFEAFGFVGLAGGLEARLIFGSNASKTPVYVAGATAALGAALGMVLAQRLKERVPPARLLVSAMVLMGAGVVAFGGITTPLGFGMLAFMAGFGFFLGKISADTIMQEALPDDFRGRGFSLFDIAYNVGWIVPAFILWIVWADDRVRAIMIGSGIFFLLVTSATARWVRAIGDQLRPKEIVRDPELVSGDGGVSP